MKRLHTSWVEIDLDAIRHNFCNMKNTASPANIMAVVKSEAYGHGLEAVALTAAEEGAWGLCIVSIIEGRRLRSQGIKLPLVLIAPILPSQMESAINDDLRPAIFDLEFAQKLSQCAGSMGKTVKIHIKIDTGMGRLSIDADHAVEFAKKIAQLPNIEIEGIYSHLASADCLDQSYTQKQFRKFSECLANIEAAGIHIPMRHLAASAGTILLTAPRLNLTRAGISMYGQWPSREVFLMMASRKSDLQKLANNQVTGIVQKDMEGTDNYKLNEAMDYLRPALTFKTVIAQVKTMQAGSCVSYGCTFKCHRETKMAVLPIGYADGYDRHLSNKGEVLIRGYRAPIMGRICMNICMVDVTDIPDVAEGDEVVLLGRQQDEYISADEIAAKIGTINYEVITRIPIHIPRFYLGKLPKGFEPKYKMM